MRGSISKLCSAKSQTKQIQYELKSSDYGLKNNFVV